VIPALILVTRPPVETVAMVGTVELQVPPVVASVNRSVLPTQTDGLCGVIATGALFMVTIFVAVHPEVSTYEMVLVPMLTPVTTPVVFTVATPGVLLLHAPPPVASVNAAVPPRQMLTGLVGRIGDEALTVTRIVVRQPVGRV
jgi:hypothetical protein